MLMQHVRCALSWTCYGIGNAAFFLIDRCAWDDDQEEPGRIWTALYDIYQWSMLKSSDLDTGDCGLWKHTTETESEGVSR